MKEEESKPKDYIDPERKQKFEDFINSKEEVDKEKSVDTNIKEQYNLIKYEDRSNKLVYPILISTFILIVLLLIACFIIVCLAASGAWTLPPTAFVAIFTFMGGVVWLWRLIVSHFFPNRSNKQ